MLKEISIMRPLLIALLVVYHAFIIYGGGWNKPTGFIVIPAYNHIVWWSYAFMLEAFTFMSGYIYIYSCRKKGVDDLRNLIVKKAKRLLLPMVLFGVLYFVCFQDYESIRKSVYEILNGAGHLWYLTMLFWCFVETWLLMQGKIDERIKLAGVAFLAIFCSWMPIPFRIATSFYYLFFFYLPVLIVDRREIIFEKVRSNPVRTLIISWGLFFFSFVLIRYVAHFPRAVEGPSMVIKALLLSLNNMMQMVYSTLGVVAFYLTALLIAGTSEPVSKDSLLFKVGNYCFGVYIFQQFVLKGLYYYTPIPGIVGPYVLPWAGAFTALVVSFVLVSLIRLTRIGRLIL